MVQICSHSLKTDLSQTSWVKKADCNPMLSRVTRHPIYAAFAMQSHFLKPPHLYTTPSPLPLHPPIHPSNTD